MLIPVATVALLLPGVMSVVSLDTDAVLEMLLASAAPVFTCTTRLKLAVPPTGSVARLPATVPLVPTAGVVRLKVGPLAFVSDTKVVLAGIVSLKVTFCAALGPLFVRLMV